MNAKMQNPLLADGQNVGSDAQLQSSRYKFLHFASFILVLLIIAGYPLIGVLATYMQSDTQSFTVPYRVIVFSLGILVMILSLSGDLPARPDKFLMLFCLMYVARLSYDWSVQDVVGAADSFVFFLIAVVVPVWACLLSGLDKIPERRFAIGILSLCTVTTIAALLGGNLGYAHNPWADQVDEINRLGYEAVNPISLGFVGSIGACCAIYLLVTERLSVQSQLALYSALTLFIILLAQTNSRGPVAALVAAGIYFSFVFQFKRLIILPLVAIPTLFAFSDELNIEGLQERFSLNPHEDVITSNVERVTSIERAIESFKENPIFGAHYLDPELGIGLYPHNIPVEIAMALGIAGLIVGGGLYVRSIYAILKTGFESRPFMSALLILQIVQSQLSGAIWAADAWLLLTGFILFNHKIVLARRHISNSQVN